jgi:putative spermidine/putrescine transport system substrate-binding protein
MSGLIAAAKKEGRLNVITLPSNWANYGTIMRDFSEKYGIKITDENPEGSSQDELNAVEELKGTSLAPDVVDLGETFAVTGAKNGFWAPYKVVTWSKIPAVAKAANGDYYAGYGGYVAIGYNPAKVKVAPTSFKSLLKPAYKNQVAIDGNPNQTGSAFAAVYAAALANHGSFADIAPGVRYFEKLNAIGTFVPVEGSPATVQSGQTPILVWWDYLLASEVSPVVKGFKIIIPTDAQYTGYYYQAVSVIFWSRPLRASVGLWPGLSGTSSMNSRSTRPLSCCSGCSPTCRITVTGCRDRRHSGGRPRSSRIRCGGAPGITTGSRTRRAWTGGER